MAPAELRALAQKRLQRSIPLDPDPPYLVLKPDELDALGFDEAAAYLRKWGYHDPGEEAVLRRSRGRK